MTLTELREVLYKTYQRCTNKVYGAHHTRFKNGLLKYITSLKALKKRKKTSYLLPKIQQWRHCLKIWKGVEDDGMYLLKATEILRQDLFFQIAYLMKDLITVLKNLLFPKAYLSYSE